MSAGRTFMAAAAAAMLASTMAAGAADLGKPAPSPLVAAPPSAQTLGWFLHAGAAGAFFAPDADVKVDGAKVSGSADVDNNAMVALDIGYFLTPDISVSLTLANPTRTTVSGDGGTVGTLGTLGKVTYLPPVLAAQYHFRQFGAFQPYVGAGVNYTMFFAEKDGALANLKVEDSFGVALQAGFDVMIDKNWGVFLDVKHVWLETTAKGSLGGDPVKADITLDPTIVHGGVTYRF